MDIQRIPDFAADYMIVTKKVSLIYSSSNFRDENTWDEKRLASSYCYASTWLTCQILFLLLLLYLNHDSFVCWLTYAADTVMTPSTYDSLTYDSSH